MRGFVAFVLFGVCTSQLPLHQQFSMEIHLLNFVYRRNENLIQQPMAKVKGSLSANQVRFVQITSEDPTNLITNNVTQCKHPLTLFTLFSEAWRLIIAGKITDIFNSRLELRCK